MLIDNCSGKQQSVINLITGITTMFIQFVVSFFLSPFIVKNLGEAANGFTQLANNFVSYASLLTLAFNSMTARFVSINYHQGNIEKAKEYYSSTIVCNLIMVVVLVPISIYIIKNINCFIVIGAEPLVDVKLLFACVFINFFLNLIGSMLQISLFVMNAVFIQNIINLLRNLLNALLLLIIFGIYTPHMFFVSAVACILTFISLPIYKIIKERIIPELKFKFSNFSFDSIRTLFASGIWNTVNQCGNILMTGLDLLLANLFIDPVAMGVLAISKTVPTAIIGVGNVINSSFSPGLVIDYATKENTEILKTLRSSIKISSVIMSIPMITFCVFGVQFYTLWMPSINAKDLTVLSFLAFLAFIPVAGTHVLYNLFTATNNLKWNSLSFIVTGILNFIVVYICLKFTDLGIYAIAGVSSVLSIIRSMFFTIPYAAKILKLRFYEFYKDVFSTLSCSMICLIIGIIIKKILNFKGWFGLILMVGISVIFSFIVEVYAVLDNNERTIVLDKIKNIF